MGPAHGGTLCLGIIFGTTYESMYLECVYIEQQPSYATKKHLIIFLRAKLSNEKHYNLCLPIFLLIRKTFLSKLYIQLGLEFRTHSDFEWFIIVWLIHDRSKTEQ